MTKFGVGYAVGLIITVITGAIVLQTMTLPQIKKDAKALAVEQGSFVLNEVVYKVTEYSKLEYPEKGTEQ